MKPLMELQHYLDTQNEFKEYLDGSQDAPTLLLDATPIIHEYLTTDDHPNAIYKLARDLWDTAYNHGYYDAKDEDDQAELDL